MPAIISYISTHKDDEVVTYTAQYSHTECQGIHVAHPVCINTVLNGLSHMNTYQHVLSQPLHGLSSITD